MTDQKRDDDCLVCCLEYALGIPYDEIPHFVGEYGGNWLEHMREWLHGRGYEVVGFDNHYPKQGVYLADGWTSRDTAHMTVWRGVDMVFDPNPSKIGLKNIRRTWWIMPLELSREASAAQPE